MQTYRFLTIDRARSLAISIAIGLGWLGAACAAPPPIVIQPAGDDNQPLSQPGVFGFINGIDRSSTLLGDMWGLRSALRRLGITLAIQETDEVFGNLTGGVQKGFVYDGLTQVVMQLDTRRAFGLYGGTFNVSGLNIHGQNLSASNLYTLQTASGIEADQATRLWELWYDQKFLDEDRLDIKIGQQSLDQEFMVNSNGMYFINTMFGWPMLPSANMPAGGPAYPLSALGARLSARPVDGMTVLAGVFNGSPVKDNNGTDPQMQNRYGTSFPLNGGQLYITEFQFSYPSLGAMVDPDESRPLGWTYKIGAWYNTESFSDIRLDQSYHSLSSPVSDGNPLQHQGNYAVYATADQLVWRDDQDPNRTVAVFGRIMGTPLKDRNLIDFSFNGGVVFHSPFRNRPADTFGVGMGYAHVSSQAAQLDRDTARFSGMPMPVRSAETFFELTYQYQLRPWIQIQPDIQYVMNPGAGLPLPSDPTSRIQNELVVGIRTNISF